MVIQQGPDLVDIAVLGEIAPPSLAAGDLRLRVSVACRGFKARHEAWVGRPDYERFLEELRALDRSRRGTATLEGLSPNAFSLRLKAFDLAGHMSIEVQLVHFWHDLRAHEGRLFVSFEFDPSMIPRALQQFEAHLPAV